MTTQVTWQNIKCDVEIVKPEPHKAPGIQLVACEDLMAEDGKYIHAGEPVLDATIQMPHVFLGAGRVIMKDHSEGQGISELLSNAGVIELTGDTVCVHDAHVPVAKLKKLA